ncbi:ligase-associated DNA damage response DEXH box helicase [Portibacter lacus]|uniref:DNA ligase-associated DEXH box helicase n=1 Tax=Portibacter lacus TaxID=1099794 RepID=A0AA37SSU3_9BACT|nr:ligase-associated DNA damage response DEXH box helicase [Portibacter lacus]GLR18904.1 DNA ligase-associated DEXH box helicase [Portibacter lacus]
MENSDLILFAKTWFKANEWKVYPFQEQAWNKFLDNYSGIINAPTGSGKTYSLLIPVLLEYLQRKEIQKEEITGLQCIWIAPIRALTKEIKLAAERAIDGFGMDWRVEIRSGDTSANDRKKQFEDPPQILITTPESLHIILCNKNYKHLLKNLKSIVVDEWHELMGSKRGVQVELALSRIKNITTNLRLWGISATIANLDQALDVLLGVDKINDNHIIIKANVQKEIEIKSLIPDKMDNFPWAGHLGIKMLDHILPIIYEHTTTLIFTNTRSQCEIWYQKILAQDPELSGLIAMHHGSMSRELREWVEENLHKEKLKAVVCTSSLDLGVDFRPVEAIIQIGSPKGVARFQQRAGRSGHRPGEKSKIFFAPTHALELMEAAALRYSIENNIVEERIPYIRSFDVLIQYLVTLAVSGGFTSEEIFKEVKSTFCYHSITKNEWDWILNFLVNGGSSLQAYDEYQKLGIINGVYKILNKRVATIHKMSIGTIVGSVSITLKYVSGKRIGTVEEYFISQFNPGDHFWFAGRPLEFVRLKGLEAQVRKSKKKTGKIPSWQGGRMSLSSNLAEALRDQYVKLKTGNYDKDDPELSTLAELFAKQSEISHVPDRHEFLIEYFETDDGYHLVFFPFEGRYVHEGLAALIARRLSFILPISFSIAMNDYGFELLSDQKIDVEKYIDKSIFSTQNLFEDIQASINAIELARRKFRDIAKISGLLFEGFPGKTKKERHLQTTSHLLFDVFREYEDDNLLFQQTFEEVRTFQLEEDRMRKALKRIEHQNLVFSYPNRPTPFAFPIIVDSLSRDKLTSETLEDRIRKMTIALEK